MICNFFTTPTELLKCRAQSTSGRAFRYSEVIPIIYAESGLPGYFRGWWATFWRDVPAWGVFFSSYKYMCDKFLPPEGEIGSDSGKRRRKDWYFFSVKLIAGGVAGWLNWIPAFPFDVIKSHI